VAINTAAVENTELVKDVAKKFGSQCVVVSIDVKRHDNGKYEVFTYSGTHPTGIDPISLAQKVADMGAGEILLTSIERDGAMVGYDIELIRNVSKAVSIPVIASGGAGEYEHMYQAIMQGNASAVAAASIFHFTQKTPLEAKKYLSEHGIHVRQ
jgi:cyclase